MDILNMIRQFHITDAGDGTIAVHSSVTPQQAEKIRQAKPEILEYLQQKKLSAKEMQEQLHQALAQIPGVKEICDARKDAPLSPLLDDLHRLYPDADFALRMVAGQKDPDYEYACICYDACKRICQGDNIQNIRSSFENAANRLLSKYMWG